MYLEKAYDGERFKINRTIRQLQAELDHDKVDCMQMVRQAGPWAWRGDNHGPSRTGARTREDGGR